jgi:hypothetical protein
MASAMGDTPREDRAIITIDTAPNSLTSPTARKGVTLTLGGVVGDGLVYVDAEGQPDARLRATTSRGLAFALNVIPAPSAPRGVSRPDMACIGYRGWPTDQVSRVELPVIAGWVTSASVACLDPTSGIGDGP